MQSVALPRAGQNPCQRREMAVSTNIRSRGGVSPKGLVHNLLVQFFTLGSSKSEVFETYFSDTVITENDHPSYVKHVLHIYVVFSLFCVCVA